MQKIPKLRRNSGIFTTTETGGTPKRKVHVLSDQDWKVGAKPTDFALESHFPAGKSGVILAFLRKNSTPRTQIGAPKA